MGQFTRDQSHRVFFVFFLQCPQPSLYLSCLQYCAALTPGRDYADTVDREILYMHLEIKIRGFCQYFCQATEINVAKICVSNVRFGS